MHSKHTALARRAVGESVRMPTDRAMLVVEEHEADGDHADDVRQQASERALQRAGACIRARHALGRADLEVDPTAVGEEHAPSSEVANQIERRHRRLPLAPNGVQSPGQGDVVDVMPRRLGHRTLLAPTRHTSEDDPRIPFQTDVGSEPKALHDAGAKPFNHDIGLFDHLQDEFNPFRILQIHSHAATTASQDIFGLS